MDAITFRASFPPIQSAIQRGQDGMRIKLDIPESDVGLAAALLALQSTRLRVTIELAEGHDDEPDLDAPGTPTAPRRRRAKRRERPGDPGV